MRHPLQRAAWAAILALCFAVSAIAATDDTVIANLGTQPVKASDIKDFLASLGPQQRQQAEKNPRVMLQLVRSAIGRKIVIDEAQKQSWDQKPEIAAQIARARDEIVLTTYLRSVAAPPASYPSDDDIRQVYDTNRDRFATPRQYHIAQIYIAEPASATKDALAALEKKARDLAKKAKSKGADFADLAASNSDDAASAKKGGDLGWLPETQILPEIVTAIKAKGDKGITDPVHVAGGWHILSVLGTKPPEAKPLDQVRDQIAAALRDTKINQNGQAYVEKLLTDRHLTVNETAAAALFDTTK